MAAIRPRSTTRCSCLRMSGRELPHVMAMLIPEAWDADTTMNAEKRAFYEYHASLMEPWDGPAAVAFTDGRMIGATLDRNGLRPARYLVTNDNMLIMASETGVLPVKPEDVKYKGRLQPGRMLLVDLEQKRIVPDEEIKRNLAARQPYGEWIKQNQITLDKLPAPSRVHGTDYETLLQRQRAFGYTDEDIRCLMTPMAVNGEEADRFDGHRHAAGLSFRQAAAAVQLLQAALRAGHESADRPDSRRAGDVAHQLHRHRAQHPRRDAAALPHAEAEASDPDQLGSREAAPRVHRAISSPHAAHAVIVLTVANRTGARARQLCQRASLAIKSGYTLLILSDRGVDDEYAPIPSLLALTAVHNHLVREGTRTQVALIIESGEPREVLHFCLLIGYGASAVNPYLAIETLEDLAQAGMLPRRRHL